MKEKLLNCIKSILSTQDVKNLEIVLVNKPSGDSTERSIKEVFPFIKLINCKKFGIAAMRNLGLKFAKGEHLLFLDVDTTLKNDLTPALDFLNKNPSVAALGGRLITPGGELQHSCRTFYDLKTILLRRTPLGKIFPHSKTIRKHLMMDVPHNKPMAVDWIQGAFFLTTRRVMKIIGKFDEFSSFGFEDVAWCYRAHKMGYKIYYLPEVTVIHEYQRESARFFSQKALYHFVAFIKFLLKYKILD